MVLEIINRMSKNQKSSLIVWNTVLALESLSELGIDQSNISILGSYTLSLCSMRGACYYFYYWWKIQFYVVTRSYSNHPILCNTFKRTGSGGSSGDFGTHIHSQGADAGGEGWLGCEPVEGVVVLEER